MTARGTGGKSNQHTLTKEPEQLASVTTKLYAASQLAVAAIPPTHLWSRFSGVVLVLYHDGYG